MKENNSKKQSKKESKCHKQIAPKDGAREKFPFYIGIDLGDKNSEICVFDEDGEVSKRLRLRMKEAEFQCYFASIPRSAVAIEAGAQSRWVADTVERCGHKVYVSNTWKVPYISQSDDKDDPGDAYKLGELAYLKPRLLHPIQHRSQAVQTDLSWIRAREALVESRTQLINTIRGISKAFGALSENS